MYSQRTFGGGVYVETKSFRAAAVAQTSIICVWSRSTNYIADATLARRCVPDHPLTQTHFAPRHNETNESPPKMYVKN